MILEKLLENIPCEVRGRTDIDITDIEFDSRKTGKGSLFFCIKGFETDGHKYAPKAVENGAEAIVTSYFMEELADVTQVIVEDGRKAMALISANFYGNPSRKLRMIGVTGTSGKTSTTYMLRSILEKAGRKVGVIGTISIVMGDRVIPSEHTTPESKDLQKILADMVDEGIQDVMMEVSSHSLYLDRVYGIEFDGSIYTNLSQDHLDFHKDFEHYFLAKSILFRNTRKAVINTDDSYGQRMYDLCTGEKCTFALERDADYRAEEVVYGVEGSTFTLRAPDGERKIELAIPGRFMVYNALGAAAITEMLGTDLDAIKEGLEAVKNVPGRVEQLDSRKHGYKVVLDYCHKPEALKDVLEMIKGYAKGDVICIFGCGGNRDREKRPIMGRIAEDNSDFVVVTSDNPRFEEPMAIIDEIVAGMEKSNHMVIEDRREAIRYALTHARKDDVILLAGKGHEDYQEIKGVHYPFDEKVVVRELLDEIDKQ